MRVSKHTSKGFSLLELLTVLAIIGIMLSFAVPSFNASLINSKLKATAEKLLYNIELARSYALANYSKITLCSSENGKDCDTNNYEWTKGYGIRLNNSDQDEFIMYEPKIKDDSIRIIKNRDSEAMNFKGAGFVTTNSNSFGVCSDFSNRIYWIAIRAYKKGYLDNKPFMCRYKLNDGGVCSDLPLDSVSASNIDKHADLDDGQNKVDCHNS